MIATEATIVSTATPQIVAQLGDLHLFSWVFSAFLLAQTAMTVVFGRLSDLVGRKPIMLAGVAVFTVGSVLVGFSWSMPSMIAFRLVQGIGAGAVQPVAMTIIADLYPAHERGKVQGWLASVWAISAVLGPLIGGLIIRNVSWAWIFWINVPVGLVAAAGFFLFLREPKVRQEGRIDVVGGLLFTVAISGLMVALSAAGTGGARTAWIAAAVFVASTAVFVAHERRAVDPMIDFALWSRRPIAAANGAGLIASMALMGLTSFLPMYVQGVLQRSPVVAGLALTMMLVGWPAGATVAARSFMRLGLQPLVRWGSCLLPLGALPFVLLSPGSSPFMAALGSLVMGFGMGLLSVSSMVLIQEIVPWSQRGTATASNIFARNLGSTLGATVLGTVLNFGLGHTRELGAVDASRLQRLLEASPDGLGSDAAVRLALHQSLHHTFWAMLAMSLLIVAVALRVPKVAIGRRADPSIAVDHSLQG
jgi:EmrB/QacA subfamily drug resistance transporter